MIPLRRLDWPTLQKQKRDRQTAIPLRWVLVVPFVLLVVGTVGLVEYLYLRNEQQLVQDFAGRLMEEVSNRVALYLNNYLETPQQINRVNASLIQFEDSDRRNPSQLQRRFLHQIQAFSSVNRIHFTNPQGGYVSVGSDQRGLTVAATDRFVKGTLRVYSIDRAGTWTSLLLTRHPYDATTRPFYRRAAETGKPTWAPIYAYVPSFQGLGLAATYPLYDKNRQLQGVLASDLSLVSITQYLRKLSIGTHGMAFIMERSGLLVASSTTEDAFVTNTDRTRYRRLQAFDSQEPLIHLAARHLVSRYGTLDHITAPTQLHVETEGRRQFLQVTPVRDRLGLDWLLVVTIPEADFTEQMDANTHLAILFSLGALVSAIALGLVTAQRIVQPIQRLSWASRALAQGDWHETLQEDSAIAELQGLTRSFNQTAAQLQRSFDHVKTALQASEERFAKVFRASPDPIAIATPDGRYLDVNDAFISLFGYPRDALVGRTAAEVGLWSNLADREHAMQRVLAGERVRNLEVTFQNHLGQQLTALYSAESMDIQGQQCIIAIAKEITDRKQLELALQQSEAKLNDILSSAITSICCYRLHPDGQLAYEYFSPSNTIVFGYTPEELCADPALWRSRVHPADRNQALGVIPPTFAEGFITTEYRFRHKDGTQRWILDHLTFCPHQDEGWIVTAVAIDNTDRKRVEAALRHSEAALRRAQQVAHVGSWELDVATENVVWSEESFHIFGWDVTQPEPTLAQFMALLHPDDRYSLEHSVRHTIATGMPYSTDFRAVLPDGTIRYVEAKGEAIVNQYEQVTQLIGTNLDITDRTQAELALRQSEAIKNQILKAIPDLILWMKVDGTCIDLIDSPTISSLFDKTKAIGKNLYDFLPSDLIQPRRNAIQQALSTGDVIVYEHQIHVQGGIRYEEVRVVKVEDDRILVIVRDVTDRKRAEDALRQYERIVAATTDGISLIDRNYIYRAINPSYLSRFNKKHDDIVGHSVAELIGQDIFEAVIKERLDACFAGQTIQYEDWFTFPTMGTQFMGVTYDPYLELDQTISGAVVTVRNLTDLKQAEAALRDSEARFRSAFQDAPIGMALIALGDRWLKVNPMLCAMLGYSETELLSMQASVLVHADDRQRFQQCAEQVLSQRNDAAQAELRYQCSGGRIAWGRQSLSLVRDGENYPLYYVAQIQDVTEQQAIDQIKNEFIAIVSHELRTPLTAIKGFLGLLNTGIYESKPEKAKRMVELALSNSDRLVRLVNDILDLERLSSGKVPLVLEACQAEELVQQAVEGVHLIADAAHVTLLVIPAAIKLWAAPDAIIQTLTNLLSNAIKFSPAHATITIATSLQTNAVLFQVQDQGRGIPADKLKTIFGRFQQVDVSDARQRGGTGLGLAICQSIIQQHNGSIWVESEVGHGSTFYFTVPTPEA
ncbi:MAG: PAS domain S-box protein [Stenomitos rutilans HA7619-LM2]|jgi:PAS domain S-box-containing protein|nr:PAS domain S-box protein [Stenomitos rutilans HA7619-LM2]